MEFNGGDFDFDLPEALTPEQWNRICLLIDGISGSFEVHFNSIRIKNEIYPFLKGPKEVNGTIVIGSSKDSKFYGEIADLNIWSNFSKENTGCIKKLYTLGFELISQLKIQFQQS